MTRPGTLKTCHGRAECRIGRAKENCKGFQRNISGVSGEERSRKVKSNGGKRAERLQK